MHPYITSQLATVRQREMLAQAEQQRLARRLARLARASRRAERAERWLRRSAGRVAVLRSELGH